MATRKLTDAQIAEAVQLHADGVSFRTLGRLYGVAPTLVHRHVTRFNAELAPEPVEPEASPEERIKDAPESGAGTAPSHPERQHTETEFPLGVPGFAPDDAPPVIVVLDPVAERRRRQDEARAQREREDIQRERERLAAWCARDDELRRLIASHRPGSDEWKAARAEHKKHLKARPRTYSTPYPSETGVRLSSHELHDGPPPSLWSNPYGHGPRGFEVIGS